MGKIEIVIFYLLKYEFACETEVFFIWNLEAFWWVNSKQLTTATIYEIENSSTVWLKFVNYLI